MQVIDEKPKRGHEKAKSESQRRLWKIIFIASCVIFLGLSFAWLIWSLRIQDPTDLEFTATVIVRMNMTTEAQLTQTFSAIGWYFVTASPNVPATATAISDQQTHIAATQTALATLQAQTILTLTAVAPSVP